MWSIQSKIGGCTVWHKIPVVVYFCGLGIFAVSRKLIFATRCYEARE